ncbi:unnamed protein product [Mycena citricolor]|uniref:Alpha-glucosidase n=1 Tax=Mycena citricolor TaxID=2018698 RepID=A0AAD2K012_9AGAR|nr:unnamed protein product [Mycena citricolor]
MLRPFLLLLWGIFYQLIILPSALTAEPESDLVYSHNTTACPGYTLHSSSLVETSAGFHAALVLAGDACNAFGRDIKELQVAVTHETETRLRVQIVDAARKQYVIPDSVLPPPSANEHVKPGKSDLVFNYTSAPFAFWITRRSAPHLGPLFDTRHTSLPAAPVAGGPRNVSVGGVGLVFEDQYLQLTTALPRGANVYGLGEVVALGGLRRDIEGGVVQTMWARDAATPVDENIYGTHPVYMEHRFDKKSGKSHTHAVFLRSSNGADIVLATPEPSFPGSLLQYRILGGTLDLTFISAPPQADASPISVIEQYTALVGLPTWQPYWAFGFHLCRWGYENLDETRDAVRRMRAAGVPLETMWNDIDLYAAFRDFTTDPVRFPEDEVREFVRELKANHQHYIPIVDVGIAIATNSSDSYAPYAKGKELDVFVKNPDINGTEYIGQVWPGYTVFPDWFAPKTSGWWAEALGNWSNQGVEYSGIWLDMNEVSSFCEGSCGTGADLSNTTCPVILPGSPDNLVTDYPEGYNSSLFGPSGNLTVNGTWTFSSPTKIQTKRDVELDSKAQDIDVNDPPYAIHNAFGRLAVHTLATNATHSGGYIELDVHNLHGLMETAATHKALASLFPSKRPVIIARSTFPSSGHYGGHWLGDNQATWASMAFSIQGLLQFQMFGIPFIGADTCGFQGNTDEELCNRWMQLSAFSPFYRNHNQRGAISQEPYVWDSVAAAAKIAINVRYSLLPYWYTLFANSSRHGTPTVRALFWEFPDDPSLFSVDRQFLVGPDILVTPVLEPNVSTVHGVFPGHSTGTIWRDWYTYKPITGPSATLSAPLGHIPVHVRSGAVLLLHSTPAYTTLETRAHPYALLVSLDRHGGARGSAYVDDGDGQPDGVDLAFRVAGGRLEMTRAAGGYVVAQPVDGITVLGVGHKPSRVWVGGEELPGTRWLYENREGAETLGVNLSGGREISLNRDVVIEWM